MIIRPTTEHDSQTWNHMAELPTAVQRITEIVLANKEWQTWNRSAHGRLRQCCELAKVVGQDTDPKNVDIKGKTDRREEERGNLSKYKLINYTF